LLAACLPACLRSTETDTDAFLSCYGMCDWADINFVHVVCISALDVAPLVLSVLSVVLRLWGLMAGGLGGM
jgi:hypothetical protein